MGQKPEAGSRKPEGCVAGCPAKALLNRIGRLFPNRLIDAAARWWLHLRQAIQPQDSKTVEELEDRLCTASQLQLQRPEGAVLPLERSAGIDQAAVLEMAVPEKPVIQDDVTGERLLLNKFQAHDPSCRLEFNAEGQIIVHISGQFSGDFDTEEGGPIVMSIGRRVA